MMENESSPLQTGVACRAEDARPDAVCADAARQEPAYPDAENPDAENPDAENLDTENLDAENPDTAYSDAETPDTVEEEDGALFEHFRFVVDKGQSLMRADKYLSSHMESTSRNRIQLAIELDIVYEDDALLVVNKPAGLVVHPGHGHFSGTLINALAYHLNLGTRPMKQRFGSVTNSAAAEDGGTGAQNRYEYIGTIGGGQERICADSACKAVFSPHHREEICCPCLG